MATKSVKTPASPKPSGRGVDLVAEPSKAADPDKAEAMAKMALRPSINAAVVTFEYIKPLGEQDLGALVDTLSAGIDDLWAGDLKRVEAMLYGQAHALQAIFVNLSRRATTQQYLKQWEAYLRMALKAQNQCRMTLETLATIKNPPAVFAQQANINNGGHQQVNNEFPPSGPETSARAANPKPGQSKLLETDHGERLDSRTAGATGGAGPQLEAMGAGHRPAQR